MVGHQPYLYEPMGRQDNRFPQSTFDPKAVTRASYEPKAPRIRQDGPLVSFNRHPDAHMVLTHRSNDYLPLSPRMKGFIKGLRFLQLIFRALQLTGAAGLLALYIILTHVAASAAWILRIAPGIAMLHCGYGIYHMSRRAGGRTPASSAAYQVFAGISDICIIPIYAFGVFIVRTHGSEWSNRLSNPELMQYFLPAAEYAALGSGVLHAVTLFISIWLGILFRKIALMPPDLNPLEDRFTTRAKHRRNKSSIATTATQESEKQVGTPLGEHRRSEVPSEDISRPPTLPFLQTRASSRSSQISRDSRVDLPSRHYQIVPSNASPRGSVMSAPLKRISAPLSNHRSSYTALSSHGNEGGLSQPPSVMVGQATAAGHTGDNQHRVAKFTETWCATDSLISRTQRRNRIAAKIQDSDNSPYEMYDAVSKRYDARYGDSDSDDEERIQASRDLENDANGTVHPQPLGSHPPRVKTPYNSDRRSALSDISLNPRQACGDDFDEPNGPPAPPHHHAGSVQREAEVFSKPYGLLKPATPPVMVGGNRKVSSGNDYDGHHRANLGRRNVSGKVVEEGRAGQAFSRYSVLNE